MKDRGESECKRAQNEGGIDEIKWDEGKWSEKMGVGRGAEGGVVWF